MMNNSTPLSQHAISRPRLGRVALSLLILVLSLVVFLLVLAPGGGLKPAWAQTQTFIFTFAGDFGTGSAFTANLNKMAQSGAVFDLAVGDLSYGSSESAWCTSVKNVVGSTFPFEVLVGNHEDDGDTTHINNFTPCLPDRMSSTGTYGAEYYFDYNNARIILVAPGRIVNGVNYDYNVAGTHRTWLINRIQEAKAAGKWVIVGNHVNCLDPATKPCETGESYMDLLHSEGVDIIIQGHDHIYARTKQLSCANSNTYTASCVADSDDSYVKGAGTVTIMDGLGGNGQYNINASDVERDYFVKAMGGNGWWNFRDGTSGAGHEYGIVKITVSATQLDEVWVSSEVTTAGFPGDSFSIIAGPTNTPAPITPTRTNTPQLPTSTPTSTPSGSPTTISFQNGVLPSASYAGNIDTILKQGSPTSNFGSAVTLEVDGDDGSGVDKSILIKWDTAAIPVGKTVTAVTITFRVLDPSASAYQFYELKRNWVESQATWNIFSTGNNWQTAGALGANDRGATVLGATGSTTINTFHTITLNASGRAVIQNWVNSPSANFGLILANATNADGLDVSSSEATTTTYRPKLTVTYQ